MEAIVARRLSACLNSSNSEVVSLIPAGAGLSFVIRLQESSKMVTKVHLKLRSHSFAEELQRNEEKTEVFQKTILQEFFERKVAAVFPSFFSTTPAPNKSSTIEGSTKLLI